MSNPTPEQLVAEWRDEATSAIYEAQASRASGDEPDDEKYCAIATICRRHANQLEATLAPANPTRR